VPKVHEKKLYRNRKIDHLIDHALDPCLQCGSQIIRTGRRFTLYCVEGRIVTFRICRACASLPVGNVQNQIELKEAA
jgi:hypothetical protein